MMTDNPLEQETTECPHCHHTNVTDDNVYVCKTCGTESCCDCAGRCGCELDDEIEE